MEQDNRNVYAESSANDRTYYQRPGQSPGSSGHVHNEAPANSFASASLTLGIIAIASVITMTIFPAIILGSLSIILALMSRGAELTFHSKARTAIILAAISLFSNVALVGSVTYAIVGDNSIHDQLNQTYEEMFGMTYDELLRGVMDGSIDSDELYEMMQEELE